jgi:hypothetical protein
MLNKPWQRTRHKWRTAERRRFDHESIYTALKIYAEKR